MQRYIDNWDATLQAPAAAADLIFQVEPALAALLTGLGAGDYYTATAVLKDDGGTETGWEKVRVTAVYGGNLTVTRAQEGSSATDWPAGTVISARLTAATMSRIDAAASGSSAYLSKDSFREQIQGGALGGLQNATAFWKPDLGGLIGLLGGNDTNAFAPLPWVGTTVITRASVRDGPLQVWSGGSAGAGFSKVSASDQRLLLTTGTSDLGSVGMTLGPGAGSGVPLSSIESAQAYARILLPALSSAGQRFSAQVQFTLPGLDLVTLEYVDDVNSGRWVIAYYDSANEYQQFNSTSTVAANTDYLLWAKLDATNLTVGFNSTTMLTVPRSNLYSTTNPGPSVAVNLSKATGTSPASLRVNDIYGDSVVA